MNTLIAQFLRASQNGFHESLAQTRPAGFVEDVEALHLAPCVGAASECHASDYVIIVVVVGFVFVYDACKQESAAFGLGVFSGQRVELGLELLVGEVDPEGIGVLGEELVDCPCVVRELGWFDLDFHGVMV